MKKAFLVLLLLAVVPLPQADACVGKALTIGVTNTLEEQVLAEMMAAVITERTGTTVQIRYFATTEELSDAIRASLVDISIENTTRALRAMNRPRETDPNKAFEIVKTAYEKDRGVVWLKPFGFLNGKGVEGPSYTATVLRVEVFNNFPALPRVLGKLGTVVNDEAYTRLVRSVEAGEQPKKVAKDFLKSKKLI
jgi:osmoprotectant transport system substrate-binding protein